MDVEQKNNSPDIRINSYNTADITREGALQAFLDLRAQAKENGISDLGLNDINKEIDLARREAAE